MISMHDMITQAVSKSFPRGRNAVIVRPKSREYSSTNKPLYKRVLYNIEQQFVDFRLFDLFHNNKVIGLQRKYKNKKTKTQRKIKNSNEIYE